MVNLYDEKSIEIEIGVLCGLWNGTIDIVKSIPDLLKIIPMVLSDEHRKAFIESIEKMNDFELINPETDTIICQGMWCAVTTGLEKQFVDGTPGVLAHNYTTIGVSIAISFINPTAVATSTFGKIVLVLNRIDQIHDKIAGIPFKFFKKLGKTMIQPKYGKPKDIDGITKNADMTAILYDVLEETLTKTGADINDILGPAFKRKKGEFDLKKELDEINREIEADEFIKTHGKDLEVDLEKQLDKILKDPNFKGYKKPKELPDGLEAFPKKKNPKDYSQQEKLFVKALLIYKVLSRTDSDAPEEEKEEDCEVCTDLKYKEVCQVFQKVYEKANKTPTSKKVIDNEICANNADPTLVKTLGTQLNLSKENINTFFDDLNKSKKQKLGYEFVTKQVFPEWEVLYNVNDQNGIFTRKRPIDLVAFDKFTNDVQKSIAKLSDPNSKQKSSLQKMISDIQTTSYKADFIKFLNKHPEYSEAIVNYKKSQKVKLTKEDYELLRERLKEFEEFEMGNNVKNRIQYWVDRSENNANSPFKKGDDFEEYIMEGLKSNTSLVYGQLQAALKNDFKIILEEYSILFQVYLCIEGDCGAEKYFIADFVLVKEGFDKNGKEIYEAIILDTKLSEKTDFTPNQTKANGKAKTSLFSLKYDNYQTLLKVGKNIPFNANIYKEYKPIIKIISNGQNQFLKLSSSNK